MRFRDAFFLSKPVDYHLALRNTGKCPGNNPKHPSNCIAIHWQPPTTS